MALSRFAIVVLAFAAIGAAPPLRPTLESRVDTDPAERFAALWAETGGKPSAEQLEARYLKPGGRPIEIFTRGRIKSAENLAKTVAARPELYRDAVERCLPWAKEQDGQFRAVNLGLRGLLPDREPPKVAVVLGALNSGGTAGEGMQVIGLEVICRMSPDRATFDRWMRNFFAHEAIHTFQRIGGPKAEADLLLTQAIAEGTPDYVASLVTGEVPDAKRDAWAQARGDRIWRDFAADRAVVRANMTAPGQPNDKGQAALLRWVMNAGSAPEGWPGEAGYWIGMEIARAYVEASPDPGTALEELLTFNDPAPILERAATRLPQLRNLRLSKGSTK